MYCLHLFKHDVFGRFPWRCKHKQTRALLVVFVSGGGRYPEVEVSGGGRLSSDLVQFLSVRELPESCSHRLPIRFVQGCIRVHARLDQSCILVRIRLLSASGPLTTLVLFTRRWVLQPRRRALATGVVDDLSDVHPVCHSLAVHSGVAR